MPTIISCHLGKVKYQYFQVCDYWLVWSGSKLNYSHKLSQSQSTTLTHRLRFSRKKDPTNKILQGASALLENGKIFPP